MNTPGNNKTRSFTLFKSNKNNPPSPSWQFLIINDIFFETLTWIKKFNIKLQFFINYFETRKNLQKKLIYYNTCFSRETKFMLCFLTLTMNVRFMCDICKIKTLKNPKGKRLMKRRRVYCCLGKIVRGRKSSREQDILNPVIAKLIIARCSPTRRLLACLRPSKTADERCIRNGC